MTEKRYSRAEIVATMLGFDVKEMRDYEYHPGSTISPVWSIGNSYYTVATPGELEKIRKARPYHDAWHLAEDEYAQSLAQRSKRRVYRLDSVDAAPEQSDWVVGQTRVHHPAFGSGVVAQFSRGYFDQPNVVMVKFDTDPNICRFYEHEIERL
jgi:hypothetical protein